MKQVIKQVVLGLLVCAPGMVLQAQAPPALPSLHVEQPRFNFGARPNTEKVKHTWTLENRGNALLKITRVKAGCGCTATRVSKRELEPGETATVEGTLDLRMRAGQMSKYITIDSNDPKNRSTKLYFVGEALSSVSVTPRHMNFGAIAETASPSRSAIIKAENGQDLQIESIRTQNKLVDTEVIPREEGKEYEVRVTVKPQAKKGSFFDLVIIQTNDKSAGSLRIHASWQIQETLSILPEQLKVKPAAAGRAANAYILLRPANHVKKDFKVTEISWPGREGITFQQVPHPQLGLRILIRNMKPDASMNGEHVVIKTTLPEFEEIRIPVSYTEAKPNAAAGK